MATLGVFDLTAQPLGWFDEAAQIPGWFDRDLVNVILPAAAVADAGRNWTTPSQDIVIDFSEPYTKLGGSYVLGDPIPGLTVQVDGGSELPLTYVSGEDTDIWTVRTATLVKNGQLIQLDYSQGAGELVAVDDASEHVAFTNLLATNNLTKRVRIACLTRAGAAVATKLCRYAILERGGNDPANISYMLRSDWGTATSSAAGLLDVEYTGPTPVGSQVFIRIHWPHAPTPQEMIRGSWVVD